MQQERKAASMRMRDQLIIIIAVAFATVSVAANVFAQTRAADRRVEMEQEGLDARWSYPAMDATTSTTPATAIDAPTPRTANGEIADRPPSAETPTPSDNPSVPCTADAPCTGGEVLDHDFRNHGQMVSAYIHALGFEEGLDGPRGSYVRQIAKPNIEEDGPPRSDRATQNQGETDKETPPGQDKDRDQNHKDTPPGQGNGKDKDEKDKDRDDG